MSDKTISSVSRADADSEPSTDTIKYIIALLEEIRDLLASK